MAQPNIKAALDAGFSLEQINDELARSAGANLVKARAAGFSEEQIAKELGYEPPAPAGQEPGIIDRAKQGLRNTVEAGKISTTNDPNEIAKLVAEGQKAQLPATAAQRRMADEIAPYQKAAEDAKGVDAIGAYASLAAKRLAQFLTNPKELAGAVVENLPNSVPGLAAGAAGAVGGAATPVPGGALIGGIAGGTVGGYMVEQGAAVRDQVLQLAQERGIDPRDANALAPLIAEKYDEILSKSRLKGIGTAGTDAALNALTLGVAGAGERVLAREANALTKTAKAAGAAGDSAALAKATADMAALEARVAARNTMGARAARGAGVTTAEMGGEGLSEAAGQQLAYGKVNPLDVVDESILGLGQGAGMAAGRGLVNKTLGMETPTGVEVSVKRAQDALSQAQTAGDAAKAAMDLADLNVGTTELKQSIDQMLGAGGAIPTPQEALGSGELLKQPLAAPTASTTPNIPALRTMADKDAALMQQANNAGFQAERENALAQAEVARGEPRQRTTENFVDLTPMDPRQAQARLAVLRDQTAQEGGNALGLAAVAHPSQPGKFAIAQQPLPSLDVTSPAPAVTTQEAQNRIETAALTGKVETAKQEDQNSRQVVIDRALRNVEDRGGVASPAEARIFQEAGLGKPYDRIDDSLGQNLSTDEKLTQATGIALGKAPRSESTQQTGLTEQQLVQQEQQDRSDSRMERLAQERLDRQNAAATDERAAAQAPNIDAVIAALRVPGTERTAEQNLTIRQGRDRLGADFQIAETAARGPFNLNTEQRTRLRALRQSVVSTQQSAEVGVAQVTPLADASKGTIVTTGAKFSSNRAPVPGVTETINDNGTDHSVTFHDASKLGAPGKLIKQIARIFGKRLVVFESPTLKADGFVRDGDNKNIYLSADSGISPLVVFGHEMLHLLKRENPEAYRAIAAVVARNLNTEGRAKFREYYGKGASLEELTADLMGNQFQDTAFWSDVFKEIAAQNPEGARAIVLKVAAALTKAINSFRNVITQGGFKSTEFVSDLDAIKAAIKDATVAYAGQQRGEAEAMAQEDQSAELGQEVTQSKRRADFTNPEDRIEVSTTSPKPAPKKGRTSNGYDEKWVIDGQDVRATDKHVAAVMKALQSYNTLSGKGNAEKLMQELHDTVVENLLWLHDLVPADVRERAKLWYDGANRIATDWTSKYGVSLRQASGVLAVLSPQMDWFKNVSLGERVTAIWKERQNEAWTPAMTDWVQSWVNASKDVDTKASRQAVLDEVRPLQGVKLADMNMRQAALFVRAFDETYFERQYRLVTPEGGFGDYVTNSDDGEASVTWGGFDTIEKAVSVLNDGSFKNIDEQLGDEHKVRNFYNNIISPNSADGHVTIDTHAVAAALVKGLSGSSPEVADNFGKAGGNAETGAGGTYGLFADAYRDAAAQRGILPREMQSITWEAVRALFPAALKDKLAPDINAVWDRFKKGEITREQARDEVKKLAGGIRKMAWEGSDEGKPASAGGTSFRQELDADPAKRQARTLAPEVAKDKVSISLSASTNSIPGIAALQAAAAQGDGFAHALLQDIALDNLRHLLAGTSARVKADGITGLYGGYVESSLSAAVSFADNDRAQVLAALAKFAENFNQEQVHVRRGVKAKAGTQFDDGSYATPVYRWELKKALTRKQIESIIEKSGLAGLSFNDDFIEAYYVGDFNEEEFTRFEQGIETAAGLVGKSAVSFGRSVERLWPYGQGAGAIGFDRVQGDVSAGDGVRSETAKRVAQYLNSGAKVKTFDQAAEITPAQSALQGEIAQVYESLPDNDLKNPNVRKAYGELAKEVMRQYKALPVKVEVMNGQGEPYANSAAMRRDILDNNHIFIFGTTPETFGPPGEDFTGHPLLEKTGLKDQNGYELLYNDLLRAVHDYYAHAMSPTQFGPKGEEAAWKNHMSMTPNMWARWALTAETRGQNSWVNFRPEVAGVPITEREFARQKAVLLPVEYSLTGDRTVDKPMKEFIAKLGERVKQGTKPAPGAKLSRTRGEQAENDALRVREKYLGTPEWLKAPNGKPTNLTERQWIQVRTPQFKEWFGDWEKHARAENPVGSLWSDDNVSKVVDDNGEPLVVYHGTDKGGFSEFNEPGGTKRGDLGIFATPNRSMAQTYVKRGRGREIEFADMEREPLEGGDTSGYYASFMNLRNPQESDFEGAHWSGERHDQWKVVSDEDGEHLSTESGQRYFTSREDAEALASQHEYASVESADYDTTGETTDSVVADARRYSHDGAIIRNVVDDGGGYSAYAGEPTDVFVAFKPNQLKSATQNTGEFGTDTNDMRFSKQRIVGESSRKYTPEQLAMFKNTGRTVEVPTIKERIASLRKDFGKKMAQGLADQFRPLKDLSKEAYALARLSKGAAGAFEAFLHHGKLKITDNVYDAENTGGFIERLGVPLHGELEDFMWWTAANRAKRLKAEGRENLFSDADIQAGLSLDQGTTDYDYTIQNGPEKGKVTRDRTKIFRDAQVTFNEFNKNALDMAEQSGLIDGESRKLWENEFYIPFYRVSEEDGGFIGAKIGQPLVRQRAFKMLKGGTDKLNSDLLANTLQNWGHLIDAAAKNRAAKASLEAAANVGVAIESNETTVRQLGKALAMRKNVVWFMDQGKERYFLVEDPHVLAAITSLEFAGMRGPLMDALSKFKHYLTIGVTASPAFKIRNLIRDSLQAVATAPLSYNVAGNLKEGFKATDRKGQDYVSMLASGALIRFGTMEGTKADNTRRLIKDGVDKSTILDSEEKVEAFYRKIKGAIDVYQEVGNRGEEINRAALYKQLRAKGMGHQEASLTARDLMDFSMQGTFTTIRFLTQVVPFMNARIQGLYKLGKSAQEDPRRFSIVLGATALASLALMAAYGDDDDWKKREDWDRNNNWWFKFGGVAWRIPKPFEIGAIATLAERGVEYFTDPEMTGKRLGKNVLDILKDNLSMNPVPQMVKPIIDIYSNKDSFSGRPIETMGMERLKPEYRFTQNTSMVARGLSTATAGAMSPVQIDHVLRGYFGWLGSFVVSGADYAIRPLTNEPSRPERDYWKMATAGIASDVDSASSRYVSQMYDQAKVLEEAYGTYRQLLKEGKTAEAAAFRESNREELTKYRSVERVKSAEAKFNERIRMIERSAMDPAEKRARILEIQKQKDRTARLVAPGLR